LSLWWLGSRVTVGGLWFGSPLAGVCVCVGRACGCRGRGWAGGAFPLGANEGAVVHRRGSQVSAGDDPVVGGRDARDSARAALTGRYLKLREGLAEKGIGARLVDDAKGKAKAAANEAVEIAKENKGIVAATLGALVVWALRKPLLDQAEKWGPRIPAAFRDLTSRIGDRFFGKDDDDQENVA